MDLCVDIAHLTIVSPEIFDWGVVDGLVTYLPFLPWKTSIFRKKAKILLSIDVDFFNLIKFHNSLL